MTLRDIFNAFSRRDKTPDKMRCDIPETTRARILLWCGEVFGNRRSGLIHHDDYSHQFLEEIHRFLSLRHGRPRLSHPQSGASSKQDDVLAFLHTCDGPLFLDFLEDIFRVECFFHVSMPKPQVVTELNDLLRADSLPYYVTDFVEQQVQESVQGYPSFGRERTVIKTLAYPRVAARQNDVVHEQIAEPALVILRSPLFKSANEEYLDALEDYRKDDFGDCLVKCGSAFESVMKVICDKKGWPYKQTDTAGPLIKIIIKHSHLDAYLEQTLVTVATLRNRLSNAHGAGTTSRRIPRYLAAYALNTTAANILLLTAVTGLERP